MLLLAMSLQSFALRAASSGGVFDSAPVPSGSTGILPVDEAFVFSWVQDGSELTLDWQVTPGHYLYRPAFQILIDGVAAELVLPEGKPKWDEYFGQVEIYDENVAIEISEAGLEQAEIEVRYQGCAEIGFCYPPQKRLLTKTSSKMLLKSKKVD